MIHFTDTKRKARLLAAAAPFAIVLGAMPAAAQDVPAATGETPSTAATGSTDASQQAAQASAQSQADTGSTGQDVIVTGSITRNPAAATASPVVSITAQDFQNRGVTTVADALQLLTANNAGTAPPSWSSFGFATGASAPSLRGLNDAYTLTLFNGMRTAPYPLGDDGYRNFVDINTIPSSIVDRVDVLLDGASATYGSDAIAGVVNVIIKRQITGLHLNASAGISGFGDAGERRASATFGYGDLDEQGFNVYVNGEYQKTDSLPVSARQYPFNTADWSQICGNSDQGCLFNGIRNGIQADGSYGGFASTRVPYVREYTPDLVSLGGYELLNPGAGCQTLNPYQLTPEQQGVSGTSNGAYVAPRTVCQEDLVNEYRNYSSSIERKGANIRATAKLGSNAEAYLMFNFYNTKTGGNNAGPQGFTGSTAAGGTTTTVSTIFLPAYVCSAGVGQVVGGALTATGCDATNGTLNPNNPYAASGNLARLSLLSPYSRSTDTDTKTYRFSGGIDGSFGGGWNYNLGATVSSVTLDTTNKGYIYLQGLLDAIAQGTFNFVSPTNNDAAANAIVYPTNYNHSVSKLTQIQASLNKDFFDLPGGALTVAVTGQYRYEAIHNPSANAPNEVNPNARYFGINAVGVDGKRDIWSAGYEITAPIFDQLKLKAEGSYDHYSTGQSRFSPKFEAEFRPIEQIKLRGTYSKGFRIPSFSEAFALPTTGYVGGQINCNSATFAAFCAQHASNPSYYQGSYSYGLTSEGNPNLSPEQSTSFTGGIVLQPTRNITFTVDYFQTKIKNVIIPVSASDDVFAQYYGNNGVVNIPGITVTPGVADPQNPGALPLIGFVAGSYKNADQFLTRGIDFNLSTKVPVTGGITWQSVANASLLLRLSQTLEDGTVQRYDGSLGACNITSCSGAPRWRAVWQNTLDFNGKGNVSLTGYYTSGYSEVAADQPGAVYGDCAATTAAGAIYAYDNGDPVRCRSRAVFDLDGHAEIKVQDRFTLYMDVQNILGEKPTFDPTAAYGLYGFNPAWSDRLFIGRFFRVGAKVDL